VVDTTPVADAPTDTDNVGAPLPSAGLFEELANTFNAARTSLSALLDLASLEARRAGLALMWMIAWGIIAAICIVTAWLGLMVALAMWSISLGLPPILAVIIFTILNLLAAAGLVYVSLNLSRDLLFSATRRQVAGKPPVKPAVS